MVKVRQPTKARGQASTFRKRARSNEEPGISDVVSVTFKSNQRRPWPAKHVDWEGNLEQGPTRSRVNHRHQSPERPALRTFTQSSHSDTSSEVSEQSDNGQGSASTAITTPDDLHPQGQWSKGQEPLGGQEVMKGQELLGGDEILGGYVPICDVEIDSTIPSEEPAEDADMCKRMQLLRDEVWQFTDTYVGSLPRGEPGDCEAVSNLFLACKETVRYVGCIALGGPDGEMSWDSLLTDIHCCMSLVFGMIGRALKEHVFGELWFGANEAQQRELCAQEQSQVDSDGSLSLSHFCSRLLSADTDRLLSYHTACKPLPGILQV